MIYAEIIKHLTLHLYMLHVFYLYMLHVFYLPYRHLNQLRNTMNKMDMCTLVYSKAKNKASKEFIIVLNLIMCP